MNDDSLLEYIGDEGWKSLPRHGLGNSTVADVDTKAAVEQVNFIKYFLPYIYVFLDLHFSFLCH